MNFETTGNWKPTEGKFDDKATREKKSEKIIPKRLSTIMEAYMRIKRKRTENEEIRTPLVTLHLQQGHKLYGRVMNCEFATGRISFLVVSNESTLDVAFLDMEEVACITLHDLDLCAEFMEELISLE